MTDVMNHFFSAYAACENPDVWDRGHDCGVYAWAVCGESAALNNLTGEDTVILSCC